MRVTRPVPRSARRAALAALIAVVVMPLSAAAQARDYLLGAPHGSFTVRGGFAFARAGSDLFDEATNVYTLEHRDFNSPTGAADLAIWLTPRFDIVLGGGYGRSTASSEYEDFEGTDDLPIAQETRFTRVPLTLSLKGYIGERGREIGTLAWIPSSFAPYVGGGAGGMWYRFEQTGEFINFETLDIFRTTLTSDGWAMTYHAFGGVDVALGPHFALVGEARYGWGSARLDPLAYSGYDNIDLSGLQTTIGFQIRF